MISWKYFLLGAIIKEFLENVGLIFINSHFQTKSLISRNLFVCTQI